MTSVRLWREMCHSGRLGGIGALSVDLRQWVWDAARVLPIFAWRPTAPRVMAMTGVAGMASFRGFQFECVGWGKCKTIDLAVVPRFCGMATLEWANSSWRPTTMLKLDHDASRPNASAVIWPL